LFVILGSLADHAMGSNIFWAPCVGRRASCFHVPLPYCVPAFYTVYVVDRNNIRLRLGLVNHHSRYCYRHVHTVLDRLALPSSFSCNIHLFHVPNHKLPMIMYTEFLFASVSECCAGMVREEMASADSSD
jgi:hypothetical protein